MSKAKNAGKGGVSLQRRMAKHGWVFISPFLVGLVLIYGEVIFNSVLYSFSTLETGVDGYSLTFAGLENYRHVLFVDAGFVRVLLASVVKMLTDIPLIIILSLFIATLLNQKMRGKAFFRAVFFIPAVLLTGVVAQSTSGNALLSSLQSTAGITTGAAGERLSAGSFLRDILTNAALSETFSQYILDAVDNIFGLINQCGVQILIFLSALQSISPSIYESARLEGATGWDCYWKITFPMISPIVYVNVSYSIIDSFVSESNTVMTLVYNLGSKQNKAGIDSAMSWLYFLVVLLFLGMATLLINKFVFYQQKEG